MDQLKFQREFFFHPGSTNNQNVTRENWTEDQVSITRMDSVYVALNTSNVRQRPTTSSPVVGRLSQGHTTNVTGMVSDGSWYRVDGEWGSGFVYHQLLVDPNDLWESVNRNMVSKRSVSARGKASLSAQPVAVLSKDEKVEVLAQNGDWYQLNMDGALAYVPVEVLRDEVCRFVTKEQRVQRTKEFEWSEFVESWKRQDCVSQARREIDKILRDDCRDLDGKLLGVNYDTEWNSPEFGLKGDCDVEGRGVCEYEEVVNKRIRICE